MKILVYVEIDTDDSEYGVRCDIENGIGCYFDSDKIRNIDVHVVDEIDP